MSRRNARGSGRQVRARHDRGKMERLLRRRDRQGLTYGQLSEVSGIPLSTLQWWKRRLSKESAVEPRQTEPSIRFIEAALSAPDPSGGRYEVVLASGRRLVLDEGFEPESVRKLIEVLEAPC